jgi:hypothetical protein
MLVELSAVGTPSSQVCFAQNSVYRNMDFVSASTVSRAVELRTADSQASPRDIYFLTTTKNMPAFGRKRLLLPVDRMMKFQKEAVMLPQREALGGGKPGAVTKMDRTAAPRVAVARPDPALDGRIKLAEVSLSAGLSPEERIEAVWPTHKTLIYQDSGRTVREGGKLYPLLVSRPSFGYHVSHAGPLYGWRLKLEARGAALEQVAPGLMRLKGNVKERAIFSTTIQAVEKPDNQ